MASAHAQLGSLILLEAFGVIAALVSLHHAVRAECQEIRRLVRERPDHD